MTWNSFINNFFSVQILVAIISSSVIGAFISSLVIKLNNDRNLKLKYITEERQKWREQIKDKVSLIISDSYSNNNELLKIATSLQLSLNPNDPNDQKITLCLDQILQDPSNSTEKLRLRKMIVQLLKHDWDRAKREATTCKIPFKYPKRKLE